MSRTSSAVLVPAALTGGVGPPVSTQTPWWSWLGGHVMILMLLGQQAAAVGLDALVPSARGHLTPVVVLGLGITLPAAVLAARASRAGAGAATA